VNGYVAAPAPGALASAIAQLDDRATTAAQLGEAGYERARLITWDGVVERLIASALREGAGPAA